MLKLMMMMMMIEKNVDVGRWVSTPYIDVSLLFDDYDIWSSSRPLRECSCLYCA